MEDFDQTYISTVRQLLVVVPSLGFYLTALLKLQVKGSAFACTIKTTAKI